MSQPSSDSHQRSWLQALPKCELHMHLEGTIEPRTLVALSERHDAVPLTLEDAEKLYHYEDFLGFLRAFGQVRQRLQTAEDYELITFDMIKTLAGQGVRHAEVYVTINGILRSEILSIESVVAAIERGRIRGEKKYGTTIFWIFDAVRQYGLEEAAVVFELAAKLKNTYPAIVGIGIGGNEEAGPAKGFKDLFQKAMQAGLRVTAHAGEAVPCFSIWDALDAGAERIGHGLTAASDPKLVEKLKELQVPLELCVTSNICTRSCRSVEEHPFRKYFDAGLLVTINSDDPPMFHTTLLDEYEKVQRGFNFSGQHMVALARNSIISSFLPKLRKDDLLRELENFNSSHSSS